MDTNNRNFFITIALSVLILTLWQVFYMNPRVEQQRETARVEAERVQAEQQQTQPATPGTGSSAPAGSVPAVPGTDGATVAGRDQALAASSRVQIDTPCNTGSRTRCGKQYRHPQRAGSLRLACNRRRPSHAMVGRDASFRRRSPRLSRSRGPRRLSP